MSATPHRLPAAQAKPVQRRHGKNGCVRLGCDVDPDIRDAMVELAWQHRSSLSDQVRQALMEYIARQRTSQRFAA